MRQGIVFYNGVLCGILSEEDDGFVFEYDDSYRRNPEARPICISMPLSKDRYVSSSLFPFFYNLLSEGSNRDLKSRINGIDTDDDFGLLLSTASYDTIGAVTVRPINSDS